MQRMCQNAGKSGLFEAAAAFPQIEGASRSTGICGIKPGSSVIGLGILPTAEDRAEEFFQDGVRRSHWSIA
jgi:hypothetical protein